MKNSISREIEKIRGPHNPGSFPAITKLTKGVPCCCFHTCKEAPDVRSIASFEVPDNTDNAAFLATPRFNAQTGMCEPVFSAHRSAKAFSAPLLTKSVRWKSLKKPSDTSVTILYEK